MNAVNLTAWGVYVGRAEGMEIVEDTNWGVLFVRKNAVGTLKQSWRGVTNSYLINIWNTIIFGFSEFNICSSHGRFYTSVTWVLRGGDRD